MTRQSEFELRLMEEKNFKSASIIDSQVPDAKGLYCIRIKNVNNMPLFSNVLKERKHNIIYIGIASKSLSKRFLEQELMAKGHGTFFRSLGAVLDFRPIPGSLSSKTDKLKKNFTFSKSDEVKIIDWIKKNLLINWIEYKGNLESFEIDLIRVYKPLLNIDKNEIALQELKDLRSECLKIARNK